MGNSISQQTLVPTSILQCLNRDGQFDTELLLQYCMNDDEFDDVDRMFAGAMLSAEQEFEENPPITPRRKRGVKRHAQYARNAAGEKITMTPKMSSWYGLYVESPNVECRKFQNKFRRRFRLPFSEYQALLCDVKDHELFSRWNNFDAVGDAPSPIELLLLGALRYLGRGWTFDDIEESTVVHEETHRQFFHVFILFGSTSLYEKHVVEPFDSEMVKSNMNEFSMAGLHGAGGSTDATHVGMEKCYHRLMNHHSGAKLKMPSRTYNLTASHRRRILSTTRGHPARWNDKTLILFDTLATGIHDGTLFDDIFFELKEHDRNGNVISRTYQGIWLLLIADLC